ncbi:major facilitator superfamily transporter [Colletotrichum asianum]
MDMNCSVDSMTGSMRDGDLNSAKDSFRRRIVCCMAPSAGDSTSGSSSIGSSDTWAAGLVSGMRWMVNIKVEKRPNANPMTGQGPVFSIIQPAMAGAHRLPIIDTR